MDAASATLHRRAFVPVFAALILLAWAVLWWWQASDYSHYILHGPQAHGIGHLHHQSLSLTGIGLYSSGWLLMCIAMMLPTSLPLILVYRRLVTRRTDRHGLLAVLLAGYLTVWLLFGLVAHLGQWGLYYWLASQTWFTDQRWLISCLLLSVAGAFQFSALKYRCLDKCRTPLSFVAGYWRGPRPYLATWRLGVHHGLYCLGCCWALMLLMFAVGTGGVLWMLCLGLLMASEKNLPGGRRLANPLGLALLFWAIWLAVEGSGLWSMVTAY